MSKVIPGEFVIGGRQRDSLLQDRHGFLVLARLHQAKAKIVEPLVVPGFKFNRPAMRGNCLRPLAELAQAIAQTGTEYRHLG